MHLTTEERQTKVGMIEVDNVTKKYRNATAIQSVSADWGLGVHGILGPNGAGKTTLLKVIAAIEEPTFGEVRLFGCHPGSGVRELRGQIGYLPQSPGTPGRFTPRDLVGYVGLLRGIPKEALTEQVEIALNDMDVADLQRNRLGKLSGGQRQRCAVAAAIVGRPSLIILDEPTSGLDPEQRIRFRQLLQKLGEDSAVLLSTHLVEDIQLGCDTVTVLDEGRVRLRGDLQALADLADGREATDRRSVSALEAGYLALMRSRDS